MRLQFSQGEQPTPSGQLGFSFGSLCLASQPSQQQLTQGERRPVPLFCEGPASSGGGGSAPSLGVGCSQQDMQLCSQDVLGTQDFITPADQFQLEYEPGNKEAAQQRSPARLSPNRVKRPRQDDDAEEESSQLVRGAGPAGPSGRELAPGRAAPRRPRSPPCYRNVFRDEDEDGFAAWTAPRGGMSDSRYTTEFKEIGQLGQGNFSKVLRARHRLNGQEFAIKRTIRELTPDNPAFAQFIQEAQVLAHTPPHPNIVQYYTSWTERGPGGGEYLFHQLEKCDINLGSLAALRESIKEADLLEVLRQMCLALRHLHAHGVAHLDVKPDNIYTLGDPEEEGGPAGLVFKLGDFGQATRFDCPGAMAVNEGDCRYLPLEVLNSDYRRLDKADMFALGATLFELASRSELPSGGQPYQDLRHGKVPLLPNITTSLLKLIKSLLSLNPDERPSAEKVLASPLLNRKASAGAAGTGAAGPPAPLQTQGSTASAQSAQSVEGGQQRLGGLVLQRSVHG